MNENKQIALDSFINFFIYQFGYTLTEGEALLLINNLEPKFTKYIKTKDKGSFQEIKGYFKDLRKFADGAD